MMSYWPQVRKTTPAKVVRAFNGVNKLDPFAINEMFSPDTINRTINDNGEHVTRPGYTVLGAAVGTRVLGLGVWKDTEIHAVFNDGTWRKWTGSAWSSPLASGLDTNAEWTFTNFKGNLSDVNLIGTNGVNSAKRYNGSTVSTLSGVPAGAKYITQYADRLWAAVGNELKASSYRMADNWSTFAGDDADSWFGIIETPDGEEINGIMPGMQKLIITKPSSTHKLMGYAPSDYTMQPVSSSTGQLNSKCAVTLDGWLYQLDETGIYRYAGGSEPERDFSEQVKDFVSRLNSTGAAYSAVGTDGAKIYFSLAINGTQPDTLLVYDPKKNTFFVWEDIKALQFARLDNGFYIGDAYGRVLKLGGSTDAGTAIEWYWTSIPFIGPSMVQIIRISRMWVTVDLPTGSTMQVGLSKSVAADDWVTVGSILAASSIQNKAIYVSSGVITNAKQMRYKVSGTGPCTIHEVAWDQLDTPVR